MSSRLSRFICPAALTSLVLVAFAALATAGKSTDQLAPWPLNLSPSAARALISSSADPSAYNYLLPDEILDAVRHYVGDTRRSGVRSRATTFSVTTSGPVNVHVDNPLLAPDGVGVTQAEVGVAVFGDTVVVGWNDALGFLAGNTISSTGWSTDGGATFTDGGNMPLALPTDQAFGDPGVATDEKGNWYFNQIYTRVAPNNPSNIAVHHGHFNALGQMLWDTPVMAAGGPANTMDKCLIAADRVTGNVYCAYTRFGGNSNIEVARSTTKGASWDPPIVLDNGVTPTASKTAARPFCGPGGEVYVVWEKGANIINCPDGLGNVSNTQGQMAFTRSLNFGVSYDPFSVIGIVDHSWTWAGPGDLRERANDFPDIAVDHSGGPYNGNIYVTWHEAAPWTSNLAPGPAHAEAADIANNNPGGAEPFVIGEDVTGTMSAAGDLDYWQFSATQGQSLFINLDPNTFNCGITGAGGKAMRLRLFATQSPYPNPTGFPDSLLAASNLGAFAQRIVWTAPKTGNYLIRLQVAGGTAPFPYRLRVRSLTFGVPNPARDARDIVLVRSSNQGASWSAEQLLNDDPPGLENRRPFVTTDGLGHVHVFWHDSRVPGLGSNASLTSIFGTTSRDGGASWTPNYLVTDELSFFSFNTTAIPNLGDYNQASANANGIVHPAWSDQRISTGDVRVPNTNSFSAGTGPEVYTAAVQFNFAIGCAADQTPSPGSTVPVAFTVTNTGTVQDSYNWNVIDTAGWPLSPSSGSISLAAGASTIVTVNVTLSTHPTVDNVTFAATPVGDPLGTKSCSMHVTCPDNIAARPAGSPAPQTGARAPIARTTISLPICISLAHPCVTVPVTFERLDATPVRGYSVTLQLSGNLSLCDGGITEDTYLSHINATFYQVTNNGGGSYTVDCAILGQPCGATGNGTLFDLHLGSGDPGGTGTIMVTAATIRDCSNQPVPGVPGAPGLVPIDNLSPAAIAALAAVQKKSGNDADGTTKIQVTWPPVEAGASVTVYRKGFGNYPEYDDPPSPGSPPPAPVTPAQAIVNGWQLTGLSASGQFDEVTTRDYWYFVAFVTDPCDNISAVSNRTNGTLNYFLGDVSNGAPGSGDNLVGTLDVSLLGANYGLTGAAVLPFSYLDFGPTSDTTPDGRPLTDDKIDFEDLIILSINYGTVSGPPIASKPSAADRDEIWVEGVRPVHAGEDFSVSVRLKGAGAMQGLSTQLTWDHAVVEPTGITTGGLMESQGGIVLSARPGNVDAALLGVGLQGITGDGVLATVQFHALATGEPRITVESVIARDSRNRPLSPVTAAQPNLPSATELMPATPNPFTGSSTLAFSVAHRGPVELSIFAVDGRRVRSLVRETREPGVYRLSWNGTDDSGRRLSPGLYYARLVTAQYRLKQAVVLLK